MPKTKSTLSEIAHSPEKFQQELIVPSCFGPRRFGEIMADFQRERFTQINEALVAVAQGKTPIIGKHYWEATKGASKDSDIGVCLLWLLAFAGKPLHMQVGAADQDQANELRKAMKDMIWLNPFLAKRIDVGHRNIVCKQTESECEIVAADVAGSHGARPDVLIMNELSHITKQEFAENMLDNATKVPHGLVIIATNAGFLGTWQHRWRGIAETRDAWTFNVRNTPSPWLSDEELEEAELRNTRSRFMRLWYGVWASGAGDALDPEDIDAAVIHAQPMVGNEPGYVFVGGLDLGAKRDHSALVVLGCHGTTGRVRLAYCQSWKPPKHGEVDLSAVQAGVLATHRKYAIQKFGFDPHQALLMAQLLRRQGVPMVEVPFIGKHLNIMATCLIESFSTHNVELFNHPQLIKDLNRLQIEEKPYGYKLAATRDDTGHADTATAFTIALPFANKKALAGCWVSTPEGHEIRPPIPPQVRLKRSCRISKHFRVRRRDGWRPVEGLNHNSALWKLPR